MKQETGQTVKGENQMNQRGIRTLSIDAEIVYSLFKGNDCLVSYLIEKGLPEDACLVGAGVQSFMNKPILNLMFFSNKWDETNSTSDGVYFLMKNDKLAMVMKTLDRIYGQNVLERDYHYRKQK